VLLDEPFSNLDHTCTHRLLAETRHIIKESGSAAVVVTHDRYEAFTLADRIAVLEEGQLQQVGTAEEIYGAPRTRHVAEFSGSASFVPAWSSQSDAQTGAQSDATPGTQWLSPLGPVPDGVAVVPVNGSDNGRYVAVVRPHQLRLRAAASEESPNEARPGGDAVGGGAPGESSAADAVVKDVRFLGSVLAVRVHVEWPSSHGAADGWDAANDELLAHIGGAPPSVRAGSRVTVEWD
jgi:ABC-type Fe3+/spermidine/putrescine transport system ATPase subunit